MMPLKRIGRPDDMAGPAIFLSSRAGSFLTARSSRSTAGSRRPSRSPSVPVEPPPTHWGSRRSTRRRAWDRRGRGRSRAGHVARGLPRRAVPDARRRRGRRGRRTHRLVVARPPRHRPARRAPGHAILATVAGALRGAVDSAFAEVVAACGDPHRPGAWITPECHRPTPGCTSSAGPTAWRRGTTRGWPAASTAWPWTGSSRRVDVPPPLRRVQGGIGRTSDPARRGRRGPAARRPVGHRSPPHAGRRRGARARYLDLLAEARTIGLPPCWT